MANSGTPWGPPRLSIAAECARRGQEEFVTGCVRLLDGHDVDDDDLVAALGGPPAQRLLHDDDGGQTYWLRVWAARGLLWQWHDEATETIRRALADPAWRVREMAAKVVARHLVGAAFDEVVDLREDPVPRVRSAADRAVARLGRARA